MLSNMVFDGECECICVCFTERGGGAHDGKVKIPTSGLCRFSVYRICDIHINNFYIDFGKSFSIQKLSEDSTSIFRYKVALFLFLVVLPLLLFFKSISVFFLFPLFRNDVLCLLSFQSTYNGLFCIFKLFMFSDTVNCEPYNALASQFVFFSLCCSFFLTVFAKEFQLLQYHYRHGNQKQSKESNMND